MRKIITFTIFLFSFIGLIYFVSTPYFFNKFITPNIKNYGFNYEKVNGSLITGFKIKGLKYKNKDLSSYVELRFNPLKLLKKVISISKLSLENVNKDTLKEIINDFRKDNINKNSSNEENSININFEIKNIFITFKPFEFKTLKVNKNILKIKKISFINGKLDLEKNYYFYDTNLGVLEFEGKFINRVLNINKISLKYFDIRKSLNFISQLVSNKNNKIQNNKNDDIKQNILFIPNKIEINTLFATLKPFKYKNIDFIKIKVNGKDIDIDITKKLIKNFNFNINFITSVSDLDTKILLKNKNLIIDNIELALLNSNKFLKFINSFNKNNKNSNSKKNSNSSIDILHYIPINNIILNRLNILVKNYTIKEERIKKLSLEAKNIKFDLNKSKLKVKNFNFLLNSSILKLSFNGLISKNIDINNSNISIPNGNKLLSFIKSFNSNESNNSLELNFIPETIKIKELKAKLNKLYFMPYEIKTTKLILKNALFDINKTQLFSGVLNIKNISNWGDSNLTGYIKNNKFFAQGDTKITQTLLDEYSVPLKAKNLKAIKIKGYFGLKDLDINANLKGEDVFKNLKDISIIESKNRIYFNYNTFKTIWDINAKLKHPLVKLASLKNHFLYINNNFNYIGLLKIENKFNFSKNIDNLLKDLKINFKGDSKGIDLILDSKSFEGKFYAKEYKKGILELKNKTTIDISNLINIKDAKLKKILVKTPIQFNQIFPLKGIFNIDSNLVTLNGNFIYNKKLNISAAITNSQKFPKKLNKKAIFPIKVDLNYDKELKIKLNNSIINSNILYANNNINAIIKNRNFNIKANGNINDLNIIFSTNSIKRSIKEFLKIYKIELPSNIDGDLTLQINSNLKKYELNLFSKEILINKNIKITNIVIDSLFDRNSLYIQRYKFNLKDFNFYSNKSSKISFKNNDILINSLYLNNSLILNGKYNLKINQGKFKIKARNFKFKNNDYDINTNLDLNLNIIRNRYLIRGLINIINGKIKKDLTHKNLADNEDIIILQKEAQKKSTFFIKNVKLNIKIKSKKGVVYTQDGSYFIAYPKLNIYKNFNSFIKIKGNIILDKRSYYIFEGKKLRLKRGKVLFKGNSSIAYLNILMHYKGREYDIYINISGNSSRPIITFSSNPPLTKEQILAYLLFNDTNAAGTHSQESMLNLIGSTLAKSFFGSIGLKIDKLSIRENGFSIGKAINNKIIIYYNQEGETPSIKARIDITKSIHSVIEVGEQKQSADIIFSKEY